MLKNFFFSHLKTEKLKRLFKKKNSAEISVKKPFLHKQDENQNETKQEKSKPARFVDTTEVVASTKDLDDSVDSGEIAEYPEGVELYPKLHEFLFNSSSCPLPEDVRFQRGGMLAYASLETGDIYVFDDKKLSFALQEIIPTPALKKGGERRRYYLQMLLLDLPLRRPSVRNAPWHDDLIAWSCAAAIKMGRKKFPGNESGLSVLESPKMLRNSASSILYDFWMSLQHQRDILIAFGSEKIKGVQFFRYNREQAIYHPISELQVKQLIHNFVTDIYQEDIPRAIGSEATKNEFLNLLVSTNPISNEVKEAISHDGRGFRNLFASLHPKTRKIEMLEYNSDLFCTNRIDIDYESAIFEEPDRKESKIVVRRSFVEFLNAFVRNNLTLGYAIKGILRGVLSAKAEGEIFQTCLYLYGPPSCGKSEIVKVIEQMCEPGQIYHMTRHDSRFSTAHLIGKRLVVVNDMENIRARDIDQIKPLIGRDTMQAELKYQNAVETIEPKCQVIMISNHPPEYFSYLREAGVKNKLIVVGLNDDAKLDPSQRVPNFHVQAHQHSVDLFNWAVHGRAEQLRQHIRAESYHEKRESNRALGGYGLHAYITDRLMYKNDKDAFLSVSDLMEDLQEYAENNQEEELLNRFAEKGNNTKLGAIIGRELAALIKDCYQRSTAYGRYTKLKNGVYGSGVRPYGLKNLCIRSVENQVSDGFEALTPKIVRKEEDINELLMCSMTPLLTKPRETS